MLVNHKVIFSDESSVILKMFVSGIYYSISKCVGDGQKINLKTLKESTTPSNVDFLISTFPPSNWRQYNEVIWMYLKFECNSEKTKATGLGDFAASSCF